MANVQSIDFDTNNNNFKVVLTGPADSSYHTGTGQVLEYNFPYKVQYPFDPVFSSGVSIDPISADGSTVDNNKIFIPADTTTFTFTIPLNFGDPYGSSISVSGSIDSVSFSRTFNQATIYTAEKTTVIPPTGGTVTTTDIEFDYSGHFDRMISAQEQLNSNIVALNSKIDTLNDKIETIKSLAEGEGIHVLGPWEWLGQVGMVQYLEEKGLDLAELKAKVEAVPKSFIPPGGGS